MNKEEIIANKLRDNGVFAGFNGLVGLLNANEFWETLPYGTRLYYGAGAVAYLHRDVLRAAINIMSEQPTSSEIKAMREKIEELEKTVQELNGKNKILLKLINEFRRATQQIHDDTIPF